LVGLRSNSGITIRSSQPPTPQILKHSLPTKSLLVVSRLARPALADIVSKIEVRTWPYEKISPMKRINWDEALKVFADRERFPDIPDNLVKYAKRCFEKENHNRLTRALLGDAEEVTNGVALMFKRAAEITGLPPGDLLKRTDFDYRDTASTRIESAFAEIRAINFLCQEGFVDIEPLQAKRKRKADIIAKKGQEKYAIEVANSIYEAKGRFTIIELKDWLLKRYYDDHKNEQLKITALEFECQRRVFVAVVDTKAIVIFRIHKDFCAAAKLAWEEAGRDSGLHICLVTGRSSSYGRDDCIFPEWP
jgi:hypothetical protein